jgi:molybdopterin-guanine dinucleotide biosynthesis protein A
MAREELHPDLCAVLLAGGKSRRMGTDKALLRVDGRPLIERLISECRRLTDEIRISAAAAGDYASVGVPVIPDIHAEHGPLAGLHAGLLATARSFVLLLACDLPGARAEWLRRMLAFTSQYDAVIPRTADGQVHPLCAVYSRSCLPEVEHNLASGKNKMTALFDGGRLRVLWLDGASGGFSDGDLRNINTPEDLVNYLGETPRTHI